MVIHIRQHVFRQPPLEFAPKRLFVVLAGIAADDLLCRSGFSREIALIDEGLTSDPAQFVTEICIPVR